MSAEYFPDSLNRYEPDTDSQHADGTLLVVHGKNFGIEYGYSRIAKDPWHLSLDSRITALAAGMLIEQAQASGQSLDVVFPTGKTAGGTIPAESESQIGFMLTRPGLRLDPETRTRNHITAGTKGFDTIGDAQEVQRRLKAKEYGRVILLTVGYHGENAAKTLKSRGVSFDEVLASEDVVAQRSPRYKAFIDKWSTSDRVKKEWQKEKRRSQILAIDRKGRSIHALAWLSRKLQLSRLFS